MILQALTEYYRRQAAADSSSVAPPGFEKKEIPWLVVLHEDGTFVDLEDTREGEGKKRRGREFSVPQSAKRTVAVKANLLWDNPGYVFGLDTKGNAGRAQQQRQAFVEAIDALPELARRDPGVAAVMAFLKRGDFSAVFAHPLWSEMAESGANLSFRLDGERLLVCQRQAVMDAVAAESGGVPSEDVVCCLVTGEEDRVARLHPAIKGVWGAQTSGANIVSFNLDAFRSFGLEQGANAPVGERAAFAYTTALNHLLGKDSRQRLQVGDASTVFWAERASPLERLIADLFGEPPKDDPGRNADAVRALFEAPKTGTPPFIGDTTRFYVLGLAPNAARIAVRFWHVGTVGQMADAIRQHFRDIEIVHAAFEPDVLSLFRLLVSTAAVGKAENIRPNLAGAVMQAILNGSPYPRELLGAALQRCRAEQQVTHPRAALIKACLNREARRNPSPANSEASVALDPKNPDRAYRLGRLFAVLERAQMEANPGLNATIRDRFFGAASTTPVTVFPRLLKLNTHHVSKLENRGRAVNLERLIGDIMDGIDDFPPLLSLSEQGRFAIGYYHQRQDFFAKREAMDEHPSPYPPDESPVQPSYSGASE